MILKGIPYLQTILTLLLCGTAFTARAQADSAEPADSCYPEIICPDSNRLGGNVAALEPLFQKLEALEKKDTTAVISILQIGDSHIQAGFFPNEVRENLQREFSNAGRGLIVPLKLAGTNEPPDYAITSPNSWNRSNCITRAATEEPGMSGMSIVTYDRHIELDIKTKEPFDRIWAFHHREAPLLTVPDSLSDGICCPDPAEPAGRTDQVVRFGRGLVVRPFGFLRFFPRKRSQRSPVPQFRHQRQHLRRH